MLAAPVGPGVIDFLMKKFSELENKQKFVVITTKYSRTWFYNTLFAEGVFCHVISIDEVSSDCSLEIVGELVVEESHEKEAA